MRLKKNEIIFAAIGLLLLASCSRELVESPNVTREEAAVTESSGKYLKFRNKDDFSRYLQEAKEGRNSLRALKMHAQYTPKGFTTIAELKARQLGLRSASESELDLVDTEMTKEEFDVFKAEELLSDPSLSLVLDTTLRVEIGDSLYAVTEVGTFIAPTIEEKQLDNAIEEMRLFVQSSDETVKLIEPIVPITSCTTDEASIWRSSNSTRFAELENIIKLSPSVDEISMNNAVKFINTYTPAKSSLANHNWRGPYETRLDMPKYHEPYNVDSYVWKEKTILGKVLGWATGSHNIGKESYFDKKHRAQLYVYDLSFGFATVTGIKARKQYRRKYLFMNVWKSTTSEKMVVGFNHLHAEVTDKSVPNLADPVAINTVNNLQTYVNGHVTNFVANHYSNIDFIKDWATDISTLVPNIQIPWIGYQFNPKVAFDYLYNAPKNEIISMLHSTADRWVYNPLRKKATKEMPRIGFFPNGAGKSKIFALGIQEYSDIGTKTITLNFSGGISFSTDGKKIGFVPFIPRDVDLKSFDIFVAIKHRSQWKGIRMTYKK